jgi:hypothetical protein
MRARFVALVTIARLGIHSLDAAAHAVFQAFVSSNQLNPQGPSDCVCGALQGV